MRAGLLSDGDIINRLNQGFVNTSIIIDEVKKRAQTGDALAQQLAAHWEYPVEMIFLTPDLKVISQMNSHKDFPGVHPDVASPPQATKRLDAGNERSHVEVFRKHLARHFEK